jgi:cytochrome P450
MTAHREIPIASRGRVGHTTEIRKHRLDFLGRIGYENRDIARGRFFDRYLVFVNSPALLREIIVDGAKSFEKQLAIRIAFFPIAGEGLTTSEGNLWLRQRKLMAPLFQHSQIAQYVDTFVECALGRASRWEDGQVIDLHRETTRLAMQVAGKTLFDAESLSEADEVGSSLTTSLHWINGRLNSPVMILQLLMIDGLRKVGVRLPQRLKARTEAWISRLRSPLLLPGAAQRKATAAIATLDRRVQQMIEERRAAGLIRPDLLTKLLQAHDEDDGSHMSDQQVRDEILTLFIGGHEGTSNSLAFTLYYLCTNPEMYRRAQAEVDAIGDRPVTYDDLPMLPYLMMVLKESMRILPPAYLFGKVATQTIEADGYVIPKGTDVFISPYSLHRRADLYPDPDRFDPERFAPGVEEARPRFSYIPFSLGPRICIGNHFALLEGQAVLASLMQRVRFELEPGQTLQPIASATLRPNSIRARVTRR